jgi:site-specific DNA-methyltransferase (adenine-specific)
LNNKFTLYNDDCLNALKLMEDNSIDSCVTDPPYGLSFMGKSWDHDVPKVEIWKEVYRVLKPGGHVIAAGGTRTYHRLVCAVEDAGFEIRDMLLWLYGTGFPKSHDVSKAIDKAAGVEFEATSASGVGFMNAEGDGGYNITKSQMIRKGESTEAAQQWQGWGTALKPACEPWVLARKPLVGTVADNVLAYGTGAINVDGCRVGTGGGTITHVGPEKSVTIHAFGGGLGAQGGVVERVDGLGRYPANVLHDGSDEVVGMFPQGSSTGAFPKESKRSQNGGEFGRRFSDQSRDARIGMNDSGSAARFFYCAKASKKDRNEGLDEMPKRRKAGAEFRPNHTTKADAGETGNPYGRWDVAANIHPTVKPTDLMKYLCRLVTPPGGLVLDPFMGSGSTGKATAQEGFRFVGIEMSPEYFKIAEARVKHAYDNVVVNLGEFFS